MDEKVFSKCGMRCDLCLIYRPNVEYADRRVEICNAWKKICQGFSPDPSTVICDGCCSEEKNAVLFSQDCETRKCVIDKGYEHCGYCDQYPCNIFPAEPTEEETFQKIEVEKQWTWEDEKLMEAYACKKYMDEFRKQKDLNDRIRKIRESEKKSHIAMYSNEELYKTDSWLKKPIKTVQELIPLFWEYEKIRVLDLGCGVGRNSIPIAYEYKNIECTIDCVDILELAIEKLYVNANEYDVQSRIHGVVKSIEEFSIKENYYDFIMAVSSLEHVESERSFVRKLEEIKQGANKNGIVCFVVNSNVKEFDKEDGNEILAQFEVNLPTEKIQAIFNNIFEGWNVLKTTVSEQQYDIPREKGISELTTSVVTFVARNEG